MGKADVETAAKLLAKAESTPYEAEAIALVERSYAMLAQVITRYDEGHPAAAAASTRRERRRLPDRRRDHRPERESSSEADGAALSRYRAVDGETAADRPAAPGADVSILL